MRYSFAYVINRVLSCVQDHGFVPMQEFWYVNSLEHEHEKIGVLSLEGSSVVAEAPSYEYQDYCFEVDHKICVHLYGASGAFEDYDDHMKACCDVFYDLLSDSELMISKMEMSKAVQSMPLQRLERKIEFTVRAIEKPEVE